MDYISKSDTGCLPANGALRSYLPQLRIIVFMNRRTEMPSLGDTAQKKYWRKDQPRRNYFAKQNIRIIIG